MKKLFAIIAVAGFLTACNDSNTNQTTTDTTTTTTKVDSIGAIKDSSAAGTNLDTATTKPAGVTADTSKIK